MNKKEFYNSVILGIPAKEILDEEQIKKSVICECKIMNKVDVYEWCAENEFKNKQLKEQIQQRDEVIEKAIEKLSFIDDALEKDILNVPLCITKINKAIDILNKYKKEDKQ